MNKKTLVLGASESSERYSNQAVRLLREYAHSIVAVGRRGGLIDEVEIISSNQAHGSINVSSNIHTVSLYVNPSLQEQHQSWLLSLKPKRVIFNPGTENVSFERVLQENGVEVVEGCTLVMLRTKQF